MDKLGWILFWASAFLMVVGMIDRITPQPLVTGVASGTYWKGAVGLVLYAIAVAVLRMEKTRP